MRRRGGAGGSDPRA
uniref:Uncharacterized protein n=1 Tax=Oryza meridionalis TaxID=40149 RepID=A0A0E0EYT9_9ORYZ